MAETPIIKITVQPAGLLRHRFRSEVRRNIIGEKRVHFCLKKAPTVKLMNCTHLDRAVVRCSLVFANKTRRYPHPHHLIGLVNGGDEDCSIDVEVSKSNEYTATFYGLGIVRTPRKDSEKEILRKLERGIDEIVKMEGWSVAMTPLKGRQMEAEVQKAVESMDLDEVALCFQGFVFNGASDTLRPITHEAYSEPMRIPSSFRMSNVKILRMHRTWGFCEGGEEICSLVEEILRGRAIKVRFYELDEEKNAVWETSCLPHNIHHDCAVLFRTPSYRNIYIDRPVKVFLQLQNPANRDTSNSVPFAYMPSNHHSEDLRGEIIPKFRIGEQYKQKMTANKSVEVFSSTPEGGE